MNAGLPAAAVLGLAACARAPEPPTPPSAELRERGRALYLESCAICHGERGDGRGQRHVYLRPAPPDFARGPVRQRLTIDHVAATVRRGVPGTSMPAWPGFSDEEVAALAVHVVSLAEAGP